MVFQLTLPHWYNATNATNKLGWWILINRDLGRTTHSSQTLMQTCLTYQWTVLLLWEYHVNSTLCTLDVSGGTQSGHINTNTSSFFQLPITIQAMIYGSLWPINIEYSACLLSDSNTPILTPTIHPKSFRDGLFTRYWLKLSPLLKKYNI